MTSPICRKCCVPLVAGDNWYACHARRPDRICKACHVKATTAWKLKNREYHRTYQREAMRRRLNIDPANYRHGGPTKRGPG